MNRLMTPDDVAEMLGVTLYTLAAWRTRGQGPAYFHLGRRVHYREADVMAFLNGDRADEPARVAS